MTLAQVLHCFHQQEKLAIQRQDENKRTQRGDSKWKDNRQDARASSQARAGLSNQEHGARGPNKPSAFKKTPLSGNKSKVSDTDPCPTHNHDHAWGACRANKRSDFNQMRSKCDDTNRHQNKKDNNTKKPAKTGADQFVVHLHKDKMDTASSTDGSVLNDEDMSDESGDSFTVNAAVANVSSFALTDIFMSHFDIQTNEDSFSTALHCVEHMSEACISGDESKLNEIKHVSQDAKLSLRPVGLAAAKKTHNAASDQPLKTLFDPGSDKTFVDRRVLPKWANGRTVDPSPINALDGVDIINQKAILEGLTLTEFSPALRKDKRAQARVFDQPNSPYDLVLGLDLLVPLGMESTFFVSHKPLHGRTKLLLGNQSNALMILI
jgi:hypothetical protein